MLKQIADDDSSQVWLDSRIIESDHPTRLLVKVDYLDYHTDTPKEDFGGQYLVTVQAVGKGWLGKEEIDACKQCMGCEDEFDGYDEIGQLLLLAEYGLAATIWQKVGNNRQALLKQARTKIKEAQVLFGFFMDRSANQLGATGWDFLRGDPTAPLKS